MVYLKLEGELLRVAIRCFCVISFKNPPCRFQRKVFLNYQGLWIILCFHISLETLWRKFNGKLCIKVSNVRIVYWNVSFVGNEITIGCGSPSLDC